MDGKIGYSLENSSKNILRKYSPRDISIVNSVDLILGDLRYGIVPMNIALSVDVHWPLNCVVSNVNAHTRYGRKSLTN